MKNSSLGCVSGFLRRGTAPATSVVGVDVALGDSAPPLVRVAASRPFAGEQHAELSNRSLQRLRMNAPVP